MRIPAKEIGDYTGKFSLYGNDEALEARLKGHVRERFKQGEYSLTKGLFLEIANWKTPRQRKQYEKNPSSFIAEITGISFEHGRDEKIRIEVLRLLEGVDYPVASVLLHFAFPEQYPILDFRVIWSLGLERPPAYSFDFWWYFVERMRDESKRHNVSLRELDKALWVYSKEHQRP